MRRALRLAALATLSTWGLAACGMGPDPASLITRPRLVGAGITITGAPGRASPLPGDEVTLQPWLLQPDAPSEVRASYLVCPAADIRRGAGGCGGAPLALVPATPSGQSLPAFTFTVPDLASLGGSSRLITLFTTCDRGASPVLDPDAMLPRCDDPEARVEVSTLELPLAFDARLANHSPSIVEETYMVEGRAWAPPPATLPPLEGCAAMPDSDALPHVVVPVDAMPPDGDEPYTIEITFTTSEDDRESYAAGPMMLREALQFSHYTTTGETSRAFSAVEPTDDASMPEVLEWTPPARAMIPAGGQLVRFTWIVRDLRGGFARADRAFCVVAGS